MLACPMYVASKLWGLEEYGAGAASRLPIGAGMLGPAYTATASRRTEEPMATPTRDDALLMVQLARWGTELGLEDAIAQILADDFDPDDADVLTDQPVRSFLCDGGR